MRLRWQTPGVVRQILAAVLFAGLAIAVRFVAIGVYEPHLPYVTLYPAVILAALYGGLYCGLLTTSLLVVYALWWVVPPFGQFNVPAPLDAIGVLLFVVGSVAMCVVTHAMHRARARSFAAEAEVRLAKERDVSAQAVRDNEEFGRQIISSIQEGLIVFDQDLRYRVWNAFMERISGVPSRDVLGKHPDEVFPWLREQGVVADLERALKGESSVQSDQLTKTATGHPTWIAGRSAPLRNRSGEITGVIVTVQDIHERKTSEAALEETQRRLKLALAASKAGVFEWNPNTGDLYWSPENYAIHGYDPSLGPATLETWQARVHPDDLERVTRDIRAAIDSPSREYLVEYRIRHPQRGERWLLGFGRVERDATGKALRLAGMNLDVTDRKLAEGVLLEATRRARCILNAGEVEGVEGWRERLDDPSQHPFIWRLAVINEAAAQDILPLDIAPGATYQDAFWRARDEETNRIANLTSAKALASGKKSYNNVFRCTDRTGRVHWLQQTVSVEAAGEGRWRIFGVSTEITQLKQTEEALAEARRNAEAALEAAEQAGRAKDHFLAVLSHELRTPLSAVIPALDMLQSRVSGPDAAYMDMARRNVELEARLIDDLLDVTRISRGKVELDRRPVDLATVLSHTVEVCKPDIEARRLQFAMETAPDVCIVNGDASRLQQVFWNVLKNAVKFTPHGGCVGVKCHASPDGKYAVVEFHDSGEGIEPESLSRIFNAFEQEARATTRQFGGLGLGLAISKALVELHGGSIHAHSEGKGNGSTFTIRLPRIHVPSESLDRSPSSACAGVTPSCALRILLVEDHGDTARIISHLLRSSGHTVFNAADVATAMEVLSRQRIDLLISDLGLPDRSGHDLLRLAREQGITAPGIALTGYGMATDIQQSLAAGFVEHITKPINFASLQAAIARVCPRVQTPQTA